MKAESNNTPSGFSLVELMIAMLVTMVISGAIFGLLTGGKTAFRREPELSDRQQNIRVAMDLIQKDIGTAGMEMADFVQAFTPGDGPQGSAPPALDGMGPLGPNGVDSDFLQIFGNTGECPSVEAKCNPDPLNPCNGAVVRALTVFPNCYRLPALVMLIGEPGANPPYSVGFACPRGTGGGGCGDPNCANFPPGQAPSYNLPGGEQIPDPLETMLPVQVVRYEIRLDADGVPNLWRSPAGNAVALAGGNACGAGGTIMNDPWQLVAKGIEDMQVRYKMAGGAESDIPATVLDGNYGTLVKEVRVTLIARSEAANLAGARDGTNAPDAKVRGSMTSVSTPRAALFVLSKAPTPEWR